MLSGSTSVADRDVSAPYSLRSLFVNSTNRQRKAQSADVVELKLIETLQKTKDLQFQSFCEMTSTLLECR